ncbi:ORF915 [White spot syndrome virus]|uniref:ORF915 n=1 Tax=White spot syndrome virus TaxID=342409 RepID=A0A2D3I6R1_9VIRU|nr:ORF915 [White spot syndrome virus]
MKVLSSFLLYSVKVPVYLASYLLPSSSYISCTFSIAYSMCIPLRPLVSLMILVICSMAAWGALENL